MISRLITYIIMMNWSFTKGIWELRCLWWVYTFSHFWQFMSLLCLSMQLIEIWVQLSYEIYSNDPIMDEVMFYTSFKYVSIDLWSFEKFLWEITFMATSCQFWDIELSIEMWCLISHNWVEGELSPYYFEDSLSY